MEIIDGRNAPGRRRLTLAPAVALVTALVLSIGAGVSGASTTTHKKAEAGGTLTWAIETNPASLFDAYYFSARRLTDLLAGPGSHPRPGIFGQPTTGPKAAVASMEGRESDDLRLHDQARDQVLGRHDDDRERRRLLDEHPSRQEDRLEDVLDFFGNVQSISIQGQRGHGEAPQARLELAVHAGRKPGPRLLAGRLPEEGRDFGTPNGLPVGTGPYKWVEFSPNSRVVLERNPYWKGVKYPWDTIVFPLIPDAQRTPAGAPERSDRRHVRRSGQRPRHSGSRRRA